MISGIEFRPAARSEFDEAADWYEQQRDGLKAEFIAAVDEALLRVLVSPQSFPAVEDSNVRRVVVGRFPYIILFEIEEGRVIVHAVFHTSRDPVIWRGRLD